MRHKWILGIGLVLVTVPFAVIMTGQARQERELARQLDLARNEGIPLSGREYAATLKSASAEENAAPLYRSLMASRLRDEEAQKLRDALLRAPSPAALRKAQQYIEANQVAYEQIDQATDLSRCWFNRDWSSGYAVLLPEYSTMRRAGTVLSLRGSVAIARGDHPGIQRDTDRLFRLARHTGEEGNIISRLVSEAVYTLGLRQLATAASLARNRPEYRQSLAKAIREYPHPDVRRERATDLYSLLQAIEQMKTPEGRREFGLKEEDIADVERIAPFLTDQVGAKVEIVKAERALWAAYGSESPDKATIDDARAARDSALMAFPTLAEIMSKLGGDEAEINTHQRRKVRQLEYTALLRAIEGGAVPRAIKTADLLSPFDGKPIAYRFDGKTITVDVRYPSGPDSPLPLQVPIRARKVLVFGKAKP